MRDAMLRPKLLLLDEPSFGLAPLVVQEIFRILRTINRNGGVSMLLVEQNANIALELADYAYLIETGCIVMGGPAAIIACDHAVRRAYLGSSGCRSSSTVWPGRFPAAQRRACRSPSHEARGTAASICHRTRWL